MFQFPKNREFGFSDLVLNYYYPVVEVTYPYRIIWDSNCNLTVLKSYDSQPGSKLSGQPQNNNNPSVEMPKNS